jgi:hypothetical protein
MKRGADCIQAAQSTRSDIMNEIIQRLIDKTGLPEDKAAAAVDTVTGFLKEKLPSPVASQIDNLMGQGGGAADQSGGIGARLGGMFGGKE